jgi:nicotinate-nucleotide adenylyltransferase
MVALQKTYPEHQFSFVIGSDNLGGYHRWLEQHPRLLEFPFYVYPREGFTFEPLYSNMTPLTGMKTVTISSTEIRTMLQRGEAITGLVDPEVERYIEEHQLYR